MNSKLIILLLIVFAGCGVKGDPIAPKNPSLPSLLQNYPDIETETPLQDHQKLK